MKKIFGLVLAGGQGTRLGGVRKADLRIGGLTLMQRVARVFDGKVTELFVASGQSAVAGYTSICDDNTVTMGPLAGIRAAVRHLGQNIAPQDLLVTVAVDSPFLPHDYIDRLCSAAQQAGCAYAAWGENIYPTNSAWRLETLRAALGDAGETAGPKAILTKLGATRVEWSAKADPFANINTLADLIAAQRWATHLGI